MLAKNGGLLAPSKSTPCYPPPHQITAEHTYIHGNTLMRDPKQYEDTAEEIRVCADHVKDATSKRQLLSCADMHERLATYAAKMQLRKLQEKK